MVEELSEEVSFLRSVQQSRIFASWLDKSRRRMEDGSCNIYESDRKENVVATFGMLYGFAEVARKTGAEIWGNLAAVGVMAVARFPRSRANVLQLNQLTLV